MFKKIILASKSKVRKKILEENKIECFVEPANVDEDLVINSIAKIKEGTIFNLSENASIVFKNKVIAQGKLKNPFKVKLG